MLSLAVALLSVLALSARADPNPKTPATTEIGQQLQIVWDPDTTGSWDSCTIALMSGSNWAMTVVTNITKTQDCTATPGQLSWTVPAVSPTSAIYFLQFTNNNEATAQPIWTTRFAIASASGQTTPPANQVEPNGQSIPWGIGSLANGAAGVAAASTPASADAIAAASSAAPVVAAQTSSPASTAPTTTVVVVSPSPSASGKPANAAVSAATSSSTLATLANAAPRSVRDGSASAAFGIILAVVVGALAA